MQWVPAGSYGKPIASNDYLCATVTLTKLPNYNSSFGWKTARLFYLGSTGWDEIASQQYGVFFDKYATNHPVCATCPGCPNWFFYWKQGGVCGIPAGNASKYKATIDYGEVGYPYTTIHLGPKAAETNAVWNRTAPNPIYGSITVGGNGTGIVCVAETVIHEKEHIRLVAK
jgi:hypothetical protein